MNALCILYRQPSHGQGKTRLRAGLRKALAEPGEADVSADRLYRAFLTDLRERVGSFEGRIYPFVADAGEDDPYWPASLRQSDGDLGRRMAVSLETAYADGADRAILIGSDAPWLDTPFLDHCLDSLDSTGSVLGPSDDGGYYLIGFRAADYTPSVFDLPEWGHSRVLEHTRDRLIAEGITLTEVETGIDFDDLDDVKRYFETAYDTLTHTFGVYKSLIWRNDNET